jgi:hypothetical protein
MTSSRIHIRRHPSTYFHSIRDRIARREHGEEIRQLHELHDDRQIGQLDQHTLHGITHIMTDPQHSNTANVTNMPSTLGCSDILPIMRVSCRVKHNHTIEAPKRAAREGDSYLIKLLERLLRVAGLRRDVEHLDGDGAAAPLALVHRAVAT